MSDLTEATAALVALTAKYGVTRDQLVDLITGPPDGGTGGDGYFPFTASNGAVLSLPGWALISLAVGLNSTVADLVDRVSAAEAFIGEAASPSADAAAAEVSRLAAVAAALDARLSQAQSFPSDFAQGSKYWTQGNGQIANPAVAANNPLNGTFATVAGVGAVYQTLPDPETCDSFGSLGYFQGVPGTEVTITAKARCIADINNGAIGAGQGVGIIPLNADFSLVEFVEGSGFASLTVADGWQTVEYNFTVPIESDSQYGTYYRPTFFYNVVGVQSPLTPAIETQGNAQFQVAWLTARFG